MIIETHALSTLSLSVCVPSTNAGGLVADCPLVHAQALLPSGGALPRLLHVSVVVRDAAVAMGLLGLPRNLRKLPSMWPWRLAIMFCSFFIVVSKTPFPAAKASRIFLVNLRSAKKKKKDGEQKKEGQEWQSIERCQPISSLFFLLFFFTGVAVLCARPCYDFYFL
jgi:hypothetical protein